MRSFPSSTFINKLSNSLVLLILVPTPFMQSSSSWNPFSLTSILRRHKATILKPMNNRPTTLHLPSHLPFPITISSLLIKPDSPIKKHDRLLVYKFFSMVSEEQDDVEEERQVKKEMVEQFDSPWEGILSEWFLEEGSVVSSARYVFSSLTFPSCWAMLISGG